MIVVRPAQDEAGFVQRLAARAARLAAAHAEARRRQGRRDLRRWRRAGLLWPLFARNDGRID